MSSSGAASTNLREIAGRLQNQSYVQGFTPSSADTNLLKELFGNNNKTLAWAGQMSCYPASTRNHIASGDGDFISCDSSSTSSSSSSSSSGAGNGGNNNNNHLSVLEKRVEALAKRWERIGNSLDELKKGNSNQQQAQSQSQPQQQQQKKKPAGDIKEWKPVKEEDPGVARLRVEAQRLDIRNVAFQWVPSDYYQQTLKWRRDTLKAPSMNHIHKSIFLENTHATEPISITNPKYVLCIYSYCDQFSGDMMMKYFRDKNPELGKKKFNFRVCKQGEELSGYSNGAVPPFGLKTDIPVVLAKRSTELSPPFIWCGGGHVDCKVRLDTQEVIDCLGAQVVDCTTALPEEELNNLTGI